MSVINALNSGVPIDTNTEGMSGGDIQAHIIDMIKDRVLMPMAIDDTVNDAMNLLNDPLSSDPSSGEN